MRERGLRNIGLAAAALLAALASGCAAPFVAGLSLNELNTGTSIFSSGITGKGLAEHLADLVTGKDCRLLEGLTRDDRAICEERGSDQTKSDFKGLAGLVAGDQREIPVAKVEPASGIGLAGVEQDGRAATANGKLETTKATWEVEVAASGVAPAPDAESPGPAALAAEPGPPLGAEDAEEVAPKTIKKEQAAKATWADYAASAAGTRVAAVQTSSRPGAATGALEPAPPSAEQRS